ncbi:YicC family protein [Spongiibacter sp. KMU-158]|uniref:YicC family protein n=2 Tax=Spongiibacter pelagi TaxID=2760804 RepID=A0A927GVI0_9GAMM|nr:YicC family protein [Spongiibacter pelagi]
MTAFAHQHTEFSWGSATWELRSVNHRYLELSFKLPDSWRLLEPKLRDALRQQLQRGKVECALRIKLRENDQELAVNHALVSQLINASRSLETQLSEHNPINVLDLLRWPGVIQATELDSETLSANLMDSFAEALAEHIRGRHREGESLSELINQRLDQISEIVATVRQRMPDIVQQQRDKLLQRIAELKVELDSNRLEQEIALIAQKADIDEELDRLNTHVEEVRRVLKKGGACGRRLDFLMQELNREANTLSSKSVVADNTQAAVELKVLIEQMREQIQNIE